MASLLTFRDGIKNFCSKYDRIVAPAIRFILALLMFWSIVHITGGHNETISSGLVIFLLAVVCLSLIHISEPTRRRGIS